MLKAILFDLGETLLDFEPMDEALLFEQAGRNSYAFLQARGHALPPFARYFRVQHRAVRLRYLWSRLVQREFNSFDLLRRLCAKMRLSLDEPTLRELAWEWYAPLTKYSSVAPDVIPTLRRLRDRGLKLAIVSNTVIPGFVLDRHMDLHGILEFFPVRIYSSELGYRKPHPKIFQAALDGLGVKAQHAVFVGDVVKADIRGAQRLGMTALLRQPLATTRTHEVADHVIRSMSDLYQILPLLGASCPTPAPQANGRVCEA